MQSIRRLVLFGAPAECERARILLENQPDISRLDYKKNELRLFCQEDYTELKLIPLLSSCGIDGFKLLRTKKNA